MRHFLLRKGDKTIVFSPPGTFRISKPSLYTRKISVSHVIESLKPSAHQWDVYAHLFHECEICEIISYVWSRLSFGHLSFFMRFSNAGGNSTGIFWGRENAGNVLTVILWQFLCGNFDLPSKSHQFDMRRSVTFIFYYSFISKWTSCKYVIIPFHFKCRKRGCAARVFS